MDAFGEYEAYRGPQYTSMERQAVYLAMRDGVRLAATVILPAGRKAGERLPAILYQTRYWRAYEFWPGFGWMQRFFDAPQRFFTGHGYAMIMVDVRGSGASFGTRRHPWSAAEIEDGREIVDWIVAQPWSNGCVAGYGTSYSGTTAELLAAVGHPAVKAVIPRFNEFDLYTDMVLPGGLYLDSFIKAWAAMNRELDANRVPRILGAMRLPMRGVKPVDGDRGRRLLRAAVKQHAANVGVDEFAGQVTYRDERDPLHGISLEDFNVCTFRDRLVASGATMYGWGGWYDGGTAGAVLHRFMTLSNPQLAVVGPWNHGGGQHASPYAPGKSDIVGHWRALLRFLDQHLKGEDTGLPSGKRLAYYTLGEERWKETDTWPPAGASAECWYLAADGALSRQQPAADVGADVYRVDMEASSGAANRWHTPMGGGLVAFEDRAAADRRLLTYTSPPLEEAIEITGHPIVTLLMRSTASDGAFFAYLEEMDEAGRVTCLVDGQIRALHRHVSPAEPPYTQFTPYHSYRREDGQPLVPGELTEVRFGLLPISVRVPRGRRLRLALAGADAGSFPRVPAAGTPEWTVERNSTYPSHIELPVIRQ